MKMSKEELKKKISEKIVDNDDLQIELLEDIEDSFSETPESDNTELEELKTKYEDLKTKYKERFFKTEEKKDEDEKTDDEMKEEDIIDIKDI